MKKLFRFAIAAITGATLLVAVSCGQAAGENTDKEEEELQPESVSVVAPDGAPALALAKMLTGDDGVTSYRIVDASTVAAYVNGKKDTVDFCILPVNAAAKLLGSGEVYQMIGSVTHGNLYLLSDKSSEKISRENLSSLVGKTVGVVNLANVPGLIFKSILADNGITYREVGNEGTISETAVNLKAIEGADVGVLNDVDYYVAPEPAASTKVGALKSKKGLDFVGDLQELYGGEKGYVQAVLVAKKQFVQTYPDYLKKFVTLLSENAEWIRSASAETIVSAVAEHVTEGMTPTFNAKNLTKSVVEHCGIRFVPSDNCMSETISLLDKMIAIDPAAAKTVSDPFFYRFEN